jgi:hypothetical protein
MIGTLRTELFDKRQCTCNVTLGRVHEVIVAVESNQYYTDLCVRMCVCVLGWRGGDVGGCECRSADV